MNTRILAALAAACLATPALARSVEPFGPVCDLPLAVMRKIPADATAVMLDGDDAARMLTAINAADPPTDFRASTILIRLFRSNALVVLFDPCAVSTVRLPLGEMREAWEAARGVRA
jgi:hypothetical protein